MVPWTLLQDYKITLYLNARCGHKRITVLCSVSEVERKHTDLNRVTLCSPVNFVVDMFITN